MDAPQARPTSATYSRILAVLPDFRDDPEIANSSTGNGGSCPIVL